MQIITGLRLKQDQRSVSNIIVVVLSLIIIVAVQTTIDIDFFEVRAVAGGNPFYLSR